MKTIILPGYSPHNKEWADELKKEMHLDHEVIVHNWQHWKKGSFTIKRELKNILDEIGEGKVNILAKSVGVRIAYELMSEIPDRINKVILAGTAGAAKEENKSALESAVKKIGVENILCVQNVNDRFLRYEDAKKFYEDVNKRFKVISKPRSDHHYPYPEDFEKFLSD